MVGAAMVRILRSVKVRARFARAMPATAADRRHTVLPRHKIFALQFRALLGVNAIRKCPAAAHATAARVTHLRRAILRRDAADGMSTRFPRPACAVPYGFEAAADL